MKRILAAAVFAALPLLLNAQAVTPETFRDDPDKSGGIYYVYHYGESDEDGVVLSSEVKAPAGYKPFYVSHVGRHGSRWHTSPYRYVLCRKVLNDAAQAGILTEYGKKLQGIMERTASRASGRSSEISPRGINEQRGIAERMFRENRPLFKGGNVRVESSASSSTRCILTMTAFDTRLSELNPRIRITPTANARCQAALREHRGCVSFYDVAKKETLADIDVVLQRIAPDVLGRIFLPGTCPFADDKAKVSVFVRSLSDLAIIAQDTDDERFFDLFTPQELYDLWESILPYRYGQYGPTYRWGDAILGDGMLVMKQILEDADRRIAGGETVASLRFGHDYTVLALLESMEIAGPRGRRTDDLKGLKDWWIDYRIAPMSTNVQMTFYRNRKGGIIVKITHNEEIQTLAGLESDIAPFYRWEELRPWMQKRIEEISKLPAVVALGFGDPVPMPVPAFGELPSEYGE